MTDEDNREKRRINRSIRSAQAWVSWGLVGLFFPIVGVIFGLIATNKTRAIEEDYDLSEYQEYKLLDVRRQGYLIVFVSLAAAVIWYLIFTSNS